MAKVGWWNRWESSALSILRVKGDNNNKGEAVKHIKQKAQNKRNWKDKLKQTTSQELKKEGMGYLTKKKKKWEEKKIGKMGFRQRGSDFLAVAAA